MAERNMRVRLGGFVALTLAALAGLIVVFGGTPTLFTNRTKYIVTFPEAPGVIPGTPVRKSGVRIGQVTALDIDEAMGNVRVSLEIENKFRPRESDEPVISRGLLSGDTTLDFVPRIFSDGKPMPRGETYNANAEIAGVPPLNARVLLNQAQGAIPNAQEALVRFASVLQKFETAAPKAEKALDEIGLLAKSIRDVVPEFRQTNLKIQEFLGANEPEQQPNTLKTLTKEVQDFVKAMKPLAEDLRTLVKDNKQDFAATLKGLKELSEKGNDLLNEDNRKALQGLIKNLKVATDDIFNEPNRKAIQDILKNAKEGSEDLTKTIRLSAILVDRADTTLKEINSRLVEAKALFENLEKATKPIGANAEPVMKNISMAADQLAKTLAEANKTIAALNSSDGTLSRVLNDPALYNGLVEATTSLNRTLARAEKVAKDLEVFADKVARKPETVGIGGALRPSTGLKESPTAPLAPGTPFPPPAPMPYDPFRPQPVVPFRGMGGIGSMGSVTPIPPISSYRVGEGLPPGPRLYPPVNTPPNDLPK